MLFLLRFFLAGGMLKSSFFASAGFMLFVTFFGVIGMFPNIIPSNLSEAAHITIAKSASSELTLTIMLCVALVCVPIVILYQSWAYWVFSHKVTEEGLKNSEEAY
jgi:cytochrome d ubiquinol oxidase subunit II